MTPQEIELEKLKLERDRLELERHRANFELYAAQVSAHGNDVEAQRANMEAVIKFAEIAIRSLLLLNGAAAIAILSFASNAAGRGFPVPFRSAVLVLGWGAALSVLTAGLSYVSQSVISEAKTPWIEKWGGGGLRVFAVFTAFLSLGAFLCGIYLAARAV